MKSFVTPRWLILPLLMLFAAQWAVPLTQVHQEEIIRRDGEIFRLALQPVDPYDAMRGRYLALSFTPPNTTLHAPQGSKAGDTVYAVLQKGDDGLAQVVRLSATPEPHAFAAPLEYYFTQEAGNSTSYARVDIPLTRFYLPENDAIVLDAILTRPTTTSEEVRVQAALDVRVMNGRIVADSLWLDGRPYREWLLNHSTNQKP